MNITIGILNSTRPMFGRSVEAAITVCESLSINCEFVFYDTSEYGDVDADGNATGMIGAIQRGEVDTAPPFFTPTFQRFRAIDFSDPVFYGDLVLITRMPDERSSSASLIESQIFSTFQWRVWCLLVGFLMVVSAYISISIDRFVRLTSDHGCRSLAVVSRFGPSEHTFFAISFRLIRSIVNKWSPLITHKHSARTVRFDFARITLAFWSMAAIVVSSSYTSMLFSEKLAQPMKYPFTNFDSFLTCLEEFRCRLITHASSASYLESLTRNHERNAQSRRIRAIFKKNPALVRYMSDIPNLITSDKNGYLVWYTTRDTFEISVGNNSDCKYYLLDSPYKEILAFPLRKGSRLKRILNRALVTFSENGLSQAITRRYQNEWHRCDWKSREEAKRRSRSSNFEPAMTKATMGFWGCGMVASLAMFGLEMVIARWKQKLFEGR